MSLTEVISSLFHYFYESRFLYRLQLSNIILFKDSLDCWSRDVILMSNFN